MDFDVEMLQRAMARRRRSDQVDQHMISLATGIPYSTLGQMTRRDYNVHYDQLKAEVVPWTISLTWDEESSKWVVRKCTCLCECDECGYFFECLPCECEGEILVSFREVLQADIERVSVSGNQEYTRLVEIVTGEKIREWRLKKYKTVEMAVERTQHAPLPGSRNSSTTSQEQESSMQEVPSNSPPE